MTMEDDAIGMKNYEDRLKEIVFTFEIKNNWEQLTNKNLLNRDIITIIKNCDKCNQIYSYPFEIEKESFNEIPCKYCKDNIIMS